MNFLAHIYLSGEEEKILVGNFLGDFVKGKNFEKYSIDIVKGIKLHREIDWFTDSHEIVDQSKSKLWDKYRHYSSVIIDMYYDHFLARNWEKFHDQPLKNFARKSYKTLASYQGIMPRKAKYMLPFMIKSDWLSSYGEISGIHKALSGMAKRTSFKSHMEKASEDLQLHYQDFEDDFFRFFPQLVAHSSEFLTKLHEEE